MRKLITILILISAGTCLDAQLFKYGVQCGGNYSIYSITESDYLIRVTRGSPGFHSGFFFRRDFENLYIGADLNYTSTIGGTVDDTHTAFDFRSGSVNMPMYFGKNFYPGIRLFVGGVPTVYIKHNETRLQAYLESSPEATPGINADLEFTRFILYIMVGTGVEINKFFIEARYEHPLDYIIKEDFSTGGTTTGIDNIHYVYGLVFTVGYRFN